jgi:hypothetical protein
MQVLDHLREFVILLQKFFDLVRGKTLHRDLRLTQNERVLLFLLLGGGFAIIGGLGGIDAGQEFLLLKDGRLLASVVRTGIRLDRG